MSVCQCVRVRHSYAVSVALHIVTELTHHRTDHTPLSSRLTNLLCKHSWFSLIFRFVRGRKEQEEEEKGGISHASREDLDNGARASNDRRTVVSNVVGSFRRC